MSIESRLARIERKMGMGLNQRPAILILGHKDGHKLGEVELQRRIDNAILARPHAKFIMLLCGGR